MRFFNFFSWIGTYPVGPDSPLGTVMVLIAISWRYSRISYKPEIFSWKCFLASFFVLEKLTFHVIHGKLESQNFFPILSPFYIHAVFRFCEYLRKNCNKNWNSAMGWMYRAPGPIHEPSQSSKISCYGLFNVNCAGPSTLTWRPRQKTSPQRPLPLFLARQDSFF